MRSAIPSLGMTRMMRSGASGVVATAIDVTAMVLLVELGGLGYALAAALSAVLGGLVNFTVSKYWAFRDRSPLETRQVATFAVVCSGTAACMAGVVHLLAVNANLPYLIAKAIASVTVFLIWTYP